MRLQAALCLLCALSCVGHVHGVATHISGGNLSRTAYAGWLRVWRSAYKVNDGHVPEVHDTMLPAALRGIPTKIVLSSGGAAGGIVTEGMGYAIMFEGLDAAAGSKEGLRNALGLVRGWLGMVYGPSISNGHAMEHPLAGGTGSASSATHVEVAPYGESAIAGHGSASAPAGMPAWKFPVDQCFPFCHGTATDGDEDAVFGMIYVAKALGYPRDFVDLVIRSIIAFASTDLGFPDLYRTLPDGSRMYVPKGGSDWGGLLPEHGKWRSSQQPWCYNPSYFAPGHYRLFRDFVADHWNSEFDSYLPSYLDGSKASLRDLKGALTGAVTAGYNILYRSSCDSGAVANWVGVKASCSSDEDLSCQGVPWSQTPYVGSKGHCTASGTTWGQYGPDASRTPWRIAMDYILYGDESSEVTMYNTRGHVDNVTFNAKTYLNRFVRQYLNHANCDGSVLGQCPAYKLADAFSESAPDMTCGNVPNTPQGWWCPFMSYPTFTAFVAPMSDLSLMQSATWMDTFASLCDFSSGTPTGSICSSSYFELSQEVVATMITSGAVIPLSSATDASAKSRHFIGPDHARVPADAGSSQDPVHKTHHDGLGWMHPRQHQLRSRHRHNASSASVQPPSSGILVDVPVMPADSLQVSGSKSSQATLKAALAKLLAKQQSAHTSATPQAASHEADASEVSTNSDSTDWPSAYQPCTTRCQHGCTCVDHGGGYHQCQPAEGHWKCGQAEIIVRRFEQIRHIRGAGDVATRFDPVALLSGLAILGLVAVAVRSFVASGGSARPPLVVPVAEYSRQPLMDDTDME